MAMEVTCPDTSCDFTIRANDEHELREIVKEHAQEKHGETYTDDQISELMQSS